MVKNSVSLIGKRCIQSIGFAMLLCPCLVFGQTTYFSRATGNWNSPSSWSTVGFGSPVNTGTFPGAGDIANIGGGFGITATVDAICATVSVGDNSFLQIKRSFTVSGQTIIGGGSSGGIFIISAAGTKNFGGLVTINSGGTWRNDYVNENVAFQGGITNNGTFISGTGNYTFNTNNQNLTGNISIDNVIVSGVVITNSNTLTVGSSMSGTGQLTQGNNATLNLPGAITISGLNATALGNTVNYNGAAQSVKNVNYHHLTLAGTGTKTLQAGTTNISGNLTLSGTASSSAVVNLTLGGSLVIGAGTSFNAGAFSHDIAGNIQNNGTLNSSSSTFRLNGGVQSITGSGVTFNNLRLTGGVKTLGVNTNVTVVFTIDNGASANLSNANVYNTSTLVLGGAVRPAGTWGSTSSLALNQNDIFFSGNGFVTVAAGNLSYYSIASGSWSDPNTWSNSGFGGGPAASTPAAGDFVFIGGGRTVNVTGSESCDRVTFDAGTSVTNTLAIGSGNSLTVNGQIIIPRTVTSGANVLSVGAGSLTSQSLSFTNTASGAAHRMTISTGTATITGDVTGIGASSSIIFSGAGLLRLGGTLFSSTNGTLTTVGGSTVEYLGSNQTIQAHGYGNLVLSGNGNCPLAATSTIAGNLAVGSGVNFIVGGVTLTVSGNSSVSGTLSITNAAGNKTFNGMLTVNSGGSWANNTVSENVTFNGGITNNGSFNAGSGVYTFDTNSQTLNGTFSISRVSVNGVGVTLTNNNNLTVGTSLQGTGGLIQASNATLAIGGSSSISNLNATASGNTVNYSGGAQAVISGNYHHLTLSGSGVKTLQTGTTSIAGNLTLTGSVSTTAVAGLAVGGSISIGSGSSFSAGTFSHSVSGDWTNNGTFIGSSSTIDLNGGNQNVTGGATSFNNLTLSGSGTKTFASGTVSVGGNLTLSGTASLVNGSGFTTVGSVTIGAGTTFNAGSFSYNVGGNWANNGNFNEGTSTINFNGPGNQDISGFSRFNNVSINSAGTVALLSSQELAGNLSLGAVASFNAGSALLTMLSMSDTQSASIGEIQSGATFNGTIIAQRFMGAEGEFNRYVSSPVTGALLSDLASNFSLVNDKGQYYDESVAGNSSKGYLPRGLSSVLQSGRGYLVKPTAAFAYGDIIWDVTGPLSIGFNQQDVDLNPTYTNHGLPNHDGWNLLGNPYPSAVVWDGSASWDIQDIEPIVYVPDVANPEYYISYDYSTGLGVPGLGTLAGGVIAMGQAFWVKAQGPGLNPSLVIHESAKTSSSGEFYRRRQFDNTGLSVALSDNVGKDVSWLMTKADASVGYDPKYDRSKLEAPAIAVAFLADGKKLANSTIPSISENIEIPLYVFVRDAGEFILSFESIGQLPEFDELFIIDKELQAVHKLSEGGYSFTASGRLESYDRFVISRLNDSSLEQVVLNVFPNPVQDLLTIETYAHDDLTCSIIDATGVVIRTGRLTISSPGVRSIRFDVSDIPPGIYFVKTHVGGKSLTKKIVKR